MSLFGGAAERLSFVLDLDSSKAISEARKTGDTMEKELGRGDKSAASIGGTLQRTGLGMMAFGGIAVAAFGKMAQAGEEAHQVDVKLADSVEHAGDKAGGSVKPFEDLASSMQKKVAFDDEAIKTSESLQLQMGLTQDQVLKMTPLIADLAAKEGVDLTTATDQVTKAINGKKKGLEAVLGPIDATAYATDHYAAVQDLLNSKVGGFAETEGKTFAGQMAILSNQLHDLEESVGQGAVKAFSTMLGAVTSVTAGLDSLGAGTTSAIGEIGTWAAAGLVAVGAGTALIGTITKQIEAFKSLAIVEAAASNPLTAVAVGVAALGAVMYEGISHAETFTANIKAMMGATTAQMDSMVPATLQMEKWGVSLHDQAEQIAGESIPAAVKFAEALERNGQDATEVRKVIDEKRLAHVAAAQAEKDETAAQDALTAEVDASIPKYQSAKEVIDAQAESQKHLSDVLKAATDPFFAIVQASTQVAEAQRNATEKQDALTVAVNTYGANSPQAAAATRDLEAANLAAAQAAAGMDASMMNLTTQVQNGSTSISAAQGQLALWVQQGLITQGQADAVSQKFSEVAGKAYLLNGQNIQMAISLDASAAEAKLRALLDATGQYAAAARENAGHALGGVFDELSADVGEQGRERLVRLGGGAVSVLPSGSFPNSAAGGTPMVLDNALVIDGRVLARQRRIFDRRH